MSVLSDKQDLGNIIFPLSHSLCPSTSASLAIALSIKWIRTCIVSFILYI